MPCITTNTPWQVYLMGRGGNLNSSFDWTYHFFRGMEDLIAVFTNRWSALPTNRIVGALWPDEADGYAHSDPKTGFPATLRTKGFRLVDPGRFPRSTTDYSAQINTFKSEKVEIVTGVLPSPAFAEFWRQARQLDFHPKVGTIAKGLLFPTALEALGDYGGGSPPRSGGLPAIPTSPQPPKRRRVLRRLRRHRPPPVDAAHRFPACLVRVGIDVLKRTKDIDSPDSIRDAIRSTDYHSLVGHIAWDGHPHKNIAKTTLVGGQWLPGSKFKNWAAGRKFKYDLVIVNNETDTEIGTQGQLEPLSAG